MDGSGVGRRRPTGSWTDGNAAARTLHEGVSGACTRLGAACFLRRPCEKRVSGQIAPESDDGLRAAGVRHVCDTQKLRSSVADSRVAVKEHPGLRQAGTAGLSQKGSRAASPTAVADAFLSSDTSRRRPRPVGTRRRTSRATAEAAAPRSGAKPSACAARGSPGNGECRRTFAGGGGRGRGPRRGTQLRFRVFLL